MTARDTATGRGATHGELHTSKGIAASHARKTSLGNFWQVRRTLARDLLCQLHEALDAHDHERAAGLAMLAVDLLVRTPSSMQRTRLGSNDLLQAAHVAALEVWHRLPARQPRERVRRAWGHMQTLVPSARSGHVLALEAVAWLLQEQSADAPDALAALRNGRAGRHLRPQLAGLVAGAAYQQWLAAWRAQPGAPEAAGEWRHDPQRWAGAGTAAQRLWRDASRQAAAALKLGAPAEHAFRLLHLHWAAGRQTQAVELLAELRASDAAGAADSRALRLLLTEAATPPAERGPQPYLDLLECDPWAAAALEAVERLQPAAASPCDRVAAHCLCLDAAGGGNTAAAGAAWASLAGCLLAEGERVVRGSGEAARGAWQELCQPLSARERWWERLHFACPPQLPAGAVQQLGHCAACAALVGELGFAAAAARLLAGAGEAAAADSVARALAMRPRLAPGATAPAPGQLQAPLMSPGAVLPLPAGWWRVVPVSRRSHSVQAGLQAAAC